MEEYQELFYGPLSEIALAELEARPYNPHTELAKDIYLSALLEINDLEPLPDEMIAAFLLYMDDPKGDGVITIDFCNAVEDAQLEGIESVITWYDYIQNFDRSAQMGETLENNPYELQMLFLAMNAQYYRTALMDDEAPASRELLEATDELKVVLDTVDTLGNEAKQSPLTVELYNLIEKYANKLESGFSAQNQKKQLKADFQSFKENKKFKDGFRFN